MKTAIAVVSLSAIELTTLKECEAIIKEGLGTFVDVGNAMMEIRDSKLYRETHETFDKYCREKWDMGRHRAYQLCDAAEVVNQLEKSKNVEAPQQNRLKTAEQAIELGKAPRSKREKVLAVASEVAQAQNKPMTALHVKDAVAEVVQKKSRFSTVSKRFGPSSKSLPKPMARGGLAAEAMRGETTNGIHVKADVYAGTVVPVKSSGNGALAEARLLVEACYETNKAKWNTPPPAMPRTIADAFLEALR